MMDRFWLWVADRLSDASWWAYDRSRVLDRPYLAPHEDEA